MAKNSLSKTFKEKVFEVVRKIPKGKVLTYKEVAVRASSPNASRVVGNLMSKNTDLDIPCHRVIRSDGTLGKYNGLRGDKRSVLLKEGVKI